MNVKNFTDQGIITSTELAALMKHDSAAVKILDATYVLPDAGLDPVKNFKEARIGEAQYFNLKDISDQKSPLPHMLPSPEEFAEKISALGISNGNFVVIYGQNGMIMGPGRAWWMFRVFGHDQICVLDGGLQNWRAENLPVNTDQPVKPAHGNFKADFRKDLVLDLEQMKKISAAKSTCILDARSAERFEGKVAEPRPGLRAGHIPNSLNLPSNALIDVKTGKLQSPEQIRKILKQLHIPESSPIVTTCGSGVTASFLALVLFTLGQKNIPVYDGSWSEWGLESAGTPIISRNQ